MPAKAMRGRKPKLESRGPEIRARLAAWNETPEYSRPSLRKLARELGTSHQLLGAYLQRWEKWQASQYERRVVEIREHAALENRPLTAGEASQADAYAREAFELRITLSVEAQLKKMFARLKEGGALLSKQELRFVNLAAQKGFPIARKVAAMHQVAAICWPERAERIKE